MPSAPPATSQLHYMYLSWFNGNIRPSCHDSFCTITLSGNDQRLLPLSTAGVTVIQTPHRIRTHTSRSYSWALLQWVAHRKRSHKNHHRLTHTRSISSRYVRLRLSSNIVPYIHGHRKIHFLQRTKTLTDPPRSLMIYAQPDALEAGARNKTRIYRTTSDQARNHKSQR